MLTGDQRQAVKKLLPEVQKFLGSRQGIPNFQDSYVKNLLEETLKEGYVTGMVKMELFSLENVEGLRVQHGNAHKYFPVKAEGKFS